MQLPQVGSKNLHCKGVSNFLYGLTNPKNFRIWLDGQIIQINVDKVPKSIRLISIDFSKWIISISRLSLISLKDRNNKYIKLETRAIKK